MIEAAAQSPTTAQTWLPAVLSAIAALIGAWLVYRNAGKANRITEQNVLADQQLAWTKQAMDEARVAKDDAKAATTAARAATDAANEATTRATAAEGRLTEVLDTAGKLMDWIGRVVRKAHEVDQNDSTAADVRELLRVINGGPPEISLSQIKRKAR